MLERTFDEQAIYEQGNSTRYSIDHKIGFLMRIYISQYSISSIRVPSYINFLLASLASLPAEYLDAGYVYIQSISAIRSAKRVYSNGF